MKKFWFATGLLLIILSVSLVLTSQKTFAADASTTYVPYPCAPGPANPPLCPLGSPYDSDHWQPYCGPGNIYKQFDRCANESYYLKRPLSTKTFDNGRWIWYQGHDGTIRPDITSANGTGPNDMSGFINVVRNDLFGTYSTEGLDWLKGSDCNIPDHTEYGLTLLGIYWCDIYSGSIIGAAQIVNNMLGMGGDNAAFKNQSAYNKYCSGPISSDPRVNGINIAKCRYGEWKSAVNYYAAQPKGSSSGYVNWSESIDFSDGADGVIDGYGPWRTDMVVYRETLGYGISNRDTIDTGSYINSAATDPADNYIIFHNPDGTRFSINKNCGNITGPVTPLKAKINYNFTPTASTTVNNTENPSTATFKADYGLDVDLSGSDTAINVVRVYYIDKLTGTDIWLDADFKTLSSADKSLDTTHPSVLTDKAINSLPSLSAGDKVCQKLIINPGTGIYDVSTGLISSGASTEDTDCITVVNRPYLSVYGGDVITGGDIYDGTAGSCTGTPSSSPIAAFLEDSSNNGSGTQLATFATGTVSGFSSAKLRSTDPLKPEGLNFSNTAIPSGSFASENCVSGYQIPTSGGTPVTSSSISNIGSLGSFTPGVFRHRRVGNLTTAGGPILPGNSIVLWVQGNMTIRGDISYFDPTGWSTTDGIPSLTIIASGDIYIDKSVKNLDGVFVSHSSIYTCTHGNPGVPYKTADNLYIPGSSIPATSCNNQLVVHGSLIANKIYWLRSYGTLKNAGADAYPGPVNAGEVIISGPEQYLAKPALPILGGSGPGGTYDAVSSLPPVL